MIIRVDLTNNQIRSEGLDESVARKYIGGGGLAAKLLWDETDAHTDPLSPQNRLIFMTGPLTGTMAPSSSRYIVAGLSPLTNIWGIATSGGFWARELKRSGFDGIVFSGKADRPVYLWVHHGEAEIVDANHLWGKDTYEVSDLLKKETDPNASVAAIGPAGERLVRFACVINDGSAGRAAARCGLGAVMGSKNLKAVVVRGTKSPVVTDREKLRESITKYYPRVESSAEDRRLRVTEHRRRQWRWGGVVIKNYLEGEFNGFLEKLTHAMLSGEDYHCWGCRSGCSESAMLRGHRRPVYESLVPLGSLCLIDNLEALDEAYDLCNKYGLDSISTGGVIAFGMEAFEKRLITKDDTEGVELTWGNHEAMVQMVKLIGERRGFGQVLGEGVRRAAQQIGGIAQEYAIHVKGLELPGHEPRASNVVALEYATDPRGACHESARGVALGHFVSPELGIHENQDTLENRFLSRGRGELTAKLQNFYCLLDSLVLCKFVVASGRSPRVVQPSDLAQWLNYVTGWNVSLEEFLKTGERVFNLQRMIGVRRGISRKDDILPPRILTHRRGGKSEAAENLPPIGEMLNEYYCYRGWSEEGIPTKERLAKLGLAEVGNDASLHL